MKVHTIKKIEEGNFYVKLILVLTAATIFALCMLVAFKNGNLF